MHHQGNPVHPADDSAAIAQALLALVLEDRSTLWALSELDRVLVPSDEARTGEPPSHVRVEDAVAELYAAGLIHRSGQFVFATRAAVEAERINS